MQTNPLNRNQSPNPDQHKTPIQIMHRQSITHQTFHHEDHQVLKITYPARAYQHLLINLQTVNFISLKQPIP